MTDLFVRPAAPADNPEFEYPRPAVVGAVLAAGGSALAGGLACAALAVVGWLGTDGGTASGAVRVGLGAWLLAHGSPLAIGAATVRLIPLGLTFAAAIWLHGVGRWVARTSAIRRTRPALAAILTLGVAYGGCGMLFAVLARTEDVEPSLVGAGTGSAMLALLAGGMGVVRASGLARRVWARTPEAIQAATFGGVAGLVGLWVGGALLLAAALLAQVQQVIDVTASLAPGVVGGALLTLMSIAYLPNAISYAMAFVLGPGFAVGTDTLVAPTAVDVGGLPSIPLVAALPDRIPGWWVLAVLVIPFAAGVVSGWVAQRRRPAFAYDLAALRGALAGATGGVAVGVLALLSAGSAGPGRLATVGPIVWEVALVAVLTLALPGAGAALLSRVWSGRRARDAAARDQTRDQTG